MTRRTTITAALLVCLATAPVQAQVTAAPGFAIDTIPVPDVVQGDVVRAGEALLVGQGGFGPGLQQIVRIDGNGATIIAEGFGGLGGFSLATDGTLYVVDNCFTGDFGCDEATTGDTVYAIPDALTRSAPLAAADAELLPAGSIGFPFDVLTTDQGLLVSDAIGPGAGRVLRVEAGAISEVVTGLDFAAGLALDGDTLLVGDLDESLVGSVARYTLAGAFIEEVAAGLSGAFGVEVDPLRSTVLVTGGFGMDFSSSLAAIDAAGVVGERAGGFGFSAGLFHDRVRDETLVLDFGVTEIAVVCADPNLDGLCDTPCVDPAPALAGKLVFGKLDDPPGNDTILLKGTATLPDTSVIDPLANGLRVFVLSAVGVPVMDALVPAGAFAKDVGAGWKVNRRRTVWTYKSTEGVAGITSIRVKLPSKRPGRVRFVAKGKKRGTFGGVQDAAGPLRARVDFGDAACVDARFGSCTSKRRGKIHTCS